MVERKDLPTAFIRGFYPTNSARMVCGRMYSPQKKYLRAVLICFSTIAMYYLVSTLWRHYTPYIKSCQVLVGAVSDKTNKMAQLSHFIGLPD